MRARRHEVVKTLPRNGHESSRNEELSMKQRPSNMELLTRAYDGDERRAAQVYSRIRSGDYVPPTSQELLERANAVFGSPAPRSRGQPVGPPPTKADIDRTFHHLNRAILEAKASSSGLNK